MTRSNSVCLALFGALLVGVFVLAPSVGSGQDKKDEPKEKKGVVVGEVVEKGKNFIKVKAFGEEKGRDYFPRWIGGLPSDGGGLDKKMLATFDKLKIGQKVRLTWEWEERFRAVQIEVLDKSDAAPPKG